jgi:hypothetical protein
VPPDGEIVLESTANGAAGCFYHEWQTAAESGYVRHFFPWWMETAYRVRGERMEELLAGGMTAEEDRLVAAYGLEPSQIAYRRRLWKDFGSRACEEFAEDAESCFIASGEAAFELEKIEARLREVGDPIETRENGRLLIWLPATAGRKYILGVDPAGGGVDGDYACVQVVERASGLQCAEFYGHYTPEELAAVAAKLGAEYNRALVAVERNNHGYAVLAMLERVERYEPLYREHGVSGWQTTSATRPRMLEALRAMLMTAPELFQSKRLLGECRTFVRRADGRVAAAEGEHDDAIMAMALALAVREEAGFKVS